MSRALLLSIRFHDGRYHGANDWPPSPARLFQALVAGTARGKELAEQDKVAFKWLETLEAPVIAAPVARKGERLKNYVPNNDRDIVGCDPNRVGKIRTEKSIRPRIFDEFVPLLYAWIFDNANDHEHCAQTICKIAERLYQLGRGIDMAYAFGEVLDEKELEERLARHGGVLNRPTKDGTKGESLLCPQKNSLTSLETQFVARLERITKIGNGRKKLFIQPPKPRFASITYNSPSHHLLFNICEDTSESSFMSLSFTKVSQLVTKLRDKVVGRLKDTMPKEEAKIDRVFVGRNATETDKDARVRIVPLPSIGHNQADYAIRRVLVEIPPNCPLCVDDIEWAFDSLEEIDPATREIVWNLVQKGDRRMLTHYGIIADKLGGFRRQDTQREAHRPQDGIIADKLGGFRLWRTVTPMAVPVMRPCGRTGGVRRLTREKAIVRAVAQSLRHTGIVTKVESIRVQREPFEQKGARAECFIVPNRFGTRGLQHVEIAFADALHGLLVIGDGRYLGLGLLAPVKES